MLSNDGGLIAKPWTVACQASLSMGFSRQEYWSGLPFPSGDLPNPGIEVGSPALQADSLPTEVQGKLCAVIMQNERQGSEIISLVSQKCIIIIIFFFVLIHSFVCTGS